MDLGGSLGSQGEMVPRSENSLGHHWQLGDQRQGLGAKKGWETLRSWVLVPPGSVTQEASEAIALAH